MSGRRSTPTAVILVVLTGTAMALTGCLDNPPAHVIGTAATATPTTGPVTTAGPSTPSADPDRPPASKPVAGAAMAAVAALPVKGRAPMTGYSRDRFGPAWQDVDGNGCDTRNDILRRDLTATAVAADCLVLRGTLHDPYSGRTIAFVRGPGTSTKVQIDHVVALGDAWQKGAQQLSTATRLGFANDPLNLLAVDGPTNQRKGDSDAASWLPPNKAFRCQYVARQVAVKLRYHLWVTTAEKAAVANVLARCPGQRLPTDGLTVSVARAAPSSQTTAKSTPAPTHGTTLPVVHPGAFCAPPGARGVTDVGTAMVCRLDSKGVRYRWGHA